MKSKIITGSVLTASMTAVLIYGGWLFFAVIMLGAGISLWEYYRLLQKKQFKPMIILGTVFGLAFIVFAYLGNWTPGLSDGSSNIGTVVSVYVFLILVIQFWQIVQRKQKYSTLDLGITVFGSLYIGVFGSFLILLMNYGDTYFADDVLRSRLVLFMPMWAAWGSDVGAYFSGKFLGRTRIFPELSPKKTLEGCLGGVVMSTVGFCIIAMIIEIPISHGFFLGIIASVFGQIGDLSESALKREVEVKDSGTIFGSHGGFLDRIDSLLFTAPVIYHYFVWVNPWG